MLEALVWVLFGLLVGWIFSFFVQTSKKNVVMMCVLGVVGALIGGGITKYHNHFGHTLEVSSIVSATSGSIILLTLVKLLMTK